MPTLKLTITYDGTRYVGWQRQATGESVQGLIEDAAARVAGHAVGIAGAGRTDAGVHALGQIASVGIDAIHSAETWLRALNALLPADIRLLRAEAAADDFHARFSATGKTYRYRVVQAPVASPFDLRYAWHVTYPLDVGAMRDALARCVGRHDFAGFQGSGSAVRDTIRTVTRATLTDTPLASLPDVAWPALAPIAVTPAPPGAPPSIGRLLTFEVEGDGFLRHMVRTIVGTVVEIGRGRWPAEAVAGMLAERDRRVTGPTAPACGLFLVEVRY